MVYIVYRGKDNNNMHMFGVKKVGRDTILASIHHSSFFKGALWIIGQSLRYQYLVLKGDF